MHAAHDRRWVVGADRNRRQVDGAEARTDVREAGEIAGVAGMIEAARRALDHPARPKPRISVGQRASREVLRRHTVNAHVADRDALPPVELDRVAADGANQLAELERYHETRAALRQRAQRV